MRGRARTFLLVIAGLTVTATVAVAQRADTVASSLTIGEAVERALTTHPTLAGAQAAAAQAVALRREAAAARLPTASLEASTTRFEEPMVVAPLHGFDPRTPPLFDRTLVQGSAGMSYTVFDGGARGARVERADALAAAAAAGVDAARQAVIAEAIATYLAAQGTRDVAEAHERRVVALEQERDRAKRLLDEGRAARVVLLRAEAALSSARAEALESRAAHDVAVRELARLTGLRAEALTTRGLAEIAFSDRTGVAAREAALREARAATPDIRQRERRVRAAEAAHAEARAGYLPRVQLGGRYVEYGAAGIDGDQWQGEWQGGVQLSYPLYTGGARSAAVDRAEAELRASRAELRMAELETERAVDRALADLATARARVEALEAAVAQSREIVRIELLALETGAGVQTDYLAAEAELLRTRAALTSARYAEALARVALSRATGTLDRGWVQANLEAR